MKRVKIIIQMALIAGGIIGCGRQKPIYNVEEKHFLADTTRLTNEEIGATITQAALKRRWHCRPVSNNKLACQMQHPKHSATIEIDYNQSYFSIKNIGSNNLLSKDGGIHRRYNRWIKLLESEIETSVNFKPVQR